MRMLEKKRILVDPCFSTIPTPQTPKIIIYIHLLNFSSSYIDALVLIFYSSFLNNNNKMSSLTSTALETANNNASLETAINNSNVSAAGLNTANASNNLSSTTSATTAAASKASPRKAAATVKKSALKGVGKGAGGSAKPTLKPKGGLAKPKAATSHPTYNDMIKKAVNELKEKKGSSRAAILKYILQHYQVGTNFAQVNKFFILNIKLCLSIKKILADI